MLTNPVLPDEAVATLQIPFTIANAVLIRATESKGECAGILAGTGNTASLHIPLANESSECGRWNSYALGEGLIAPFRQLRELNLKLLAIYHSHPKGPAMPSQRDWEEWTYPTVLQIIMAAGMLKAYHYLPTAPFFASVTIDFINA